MNLEQAEQLGFDRSIELGPFYIHILHYGCSQCEAAIVDGIPVHERNCPNSADECQDCGAIVPRGTRLCTECANRL